MPQAARAAEAAPSFPSSRPAEAVIPCCWQLAAAAAREALTGQLREDLAKKAVRALLGAAGV